MLKLNLGSGECPLDGYENLDAKTGDSLFPLARDFRGKPQVFVLDGVADEIRASHVLEHFPHGQTLDVLKEWVRVLKPGGWLKIAVPDFDWIAAGWRSDSSIEPESLLQAYLFGGQVDENDFHKALFNEYKLRRHFEDAGLVNVQPWTSEIQDCASLPVSLNLMGQKPEAGAKCIHGEIIDWTGRSPNSYWRKCPCCGHIFEVITEARSLCLRCGKDHPSIEMREPVKVEQKPEVAKLAVLHQAYDGQAVCFKCGKPVRDWIPNERCAPQSKARTQVFAAGRWQDLDGEVQCATQEEVDAANRGELQTRTIVVGERRAARVALCLSTPRIGFLRPLERLLGVMHQAGVSVFSGDGVFWHHSLSRSIKNACDFYFEDSGEGFDFILTADYDTYALPEDLKAIVELLARNPQADCIVSMQMKRGGTGEILAGGSNMNLTAPLVPIETGHFGFTLFRKEFFEKLPTPWFYEKPDMDGHWGDGRIDSDIGFWLNAKKAKLNVMLAPQIVVGHGEELITYPRIIGGKPQKVYQAVNDWLSVRTKPEGIGVQL